LVATLHVLRLSPDVLALAKEYAAVLSVPARAAADLVHIACAVVHEVDYLVTWNCAHIANGDVMRRLLAANAGTGRHTPLLVTPEALLDPT
jgi:hypothetical protein